MSSDDRTPTYRLNIDPEDDPHLRDLDGRLVDEVEPVDGDSYIVTVGDERVLVAGHELVEDDRELTTDGGIEDAGRERPEQVNGIPVEWRERHGVMKCYVEVPLGETRVLTVPRYIKNPFTNRRHDLTKLSDDGYLKPFLALLAATNTPDHIDVGSAPVLTFDKDRWERREMDGQHVLVKREAETKFEEMVVGNDCSLHTDRDGQ